MAAREASDCRRSEIHASIAWSTDHRSRLSARAFIKGIITVAIKDWRGESERFYNRISSDESGPSISDPTDATFPKTVHRGPFIITVDRFDRTVTIQSPLNSLVLHECKHPS